MIAIQHRECLERVEEAISDVGALLWAQEALIVANTEEVVAGDGRHALDLLRSIIIEKQNEAERATSALRKALDSKENAA
ncbi:hypothetical protein [Alloyangia pacifica]|uniref:hypothetical protein n=1 Tax=Alloyangia pacifica TaxID=311180 RepID=UPI001CFE62C7|nr:hypothetical protein [Alloyangia pacifica]